MLGSKTTRKARLATLLTVGVFGSVLAACGDDDDSDSAPAADQSSPAQRCIDSWNAKANGDQQTSLAGVVSATGLDPEALRVGTWTGGERTVPVRSPKAAFAESDGRAAVPKGSCLVVTPPSHAGKGAFVGDGGKWQFVWSADRTQFPADARRSIADAEDATADALGKLKLE
jgi:hypothetical protein